MKGKFLKTRSGKAREQSEEDVDSREKAEEDLQVTFKATLFIQIERPYAPAFLFRILTCFEPLS
jgi:hypothetical protein